MNNNTKKITTGAMLLAIIGALLLIDRTLSYAFTTIILTLMPAVIVVYGAMYEFKDSVIFSIATLLLGFVINPTISFLVYTIIASIVGCGYCYGVKKNFDQKRLLVIAMFLYVVGEIVSLLVITPLLGFGGLDSLVGEIETMFDEISKYSGNSLSLEALGFTSSTILTIAGISTIVTGALEGLLVHLTSLILLRRFKIKDITKGGTVTFNLSAPVAYVLMTIVLAQMMLYQRIDNELVKNILLGASLVSSLVLMYYGYIVLLTIVRLKFQNRRSGFYTLLLIFLFVPLSLYLLMVIGFLYGSGPLKRTLINKGKQI